MYCKHCGKELHQEQAICLQCGTLKGDGVSYCQNCGQQVNEFAAICTHCGVPLTKPNSPTVPNSANQPTKSKGVASLSFIPKFILSGLAILFLFIDGFFIYTSVNNGSSDYGNSGSFYYLWDESFVIMIPILVFITVSLVMSFISIFKGRKSLGWIGFSFSLATLLYLIITSLIGQEEFYYYYEGYITVYGYKIPHVFFHYFDSFDILFFLEIPINVLIVVISLLEGIGKPLFKRKSKKQSTIEYL